MPRHGTLRACFWAIHRLLPSRTSCRSYYTTERTRQQTGVLLPLIAGIIFVRDHHPRHNAEARRDALAGGGVGIAVNAVITAVFWLVWQAVSEGEARLKRNGSGETPPAASCNEGV